MCKSFFALFAVGLFLIDDVTSYNPLLTYTIRFKKMSMYPNVTGEYTIDQYKDKQYINANFTINSNETVDTVVGVFYRCNLEGFDCEYFQTWQLLDICSKLKDKNQIWSKWYSAFYPPMLCPINKVHYQLRNGTFDISKAVQWYPDVTNYYWKLVQKLYAGDTFIGSYTIEMVSFGYRRKPKSV